MSPLAETFRGQSPNKGLVVTEKRRSFFNKGNGESLEFATQEWYGDLGTGYSIFNIKGIN